MLNNDKAVPNLSAIN